MIRKVHHNQLLVYSALQFNLGKRVLFRLTVVSQIEGTEDFLGIECQVVQEMVIGVRNVLEEGTVKPFLPYTSPSKNSDSVIQWLSSPILDLKSGASVSAIRVAAAIDL